MLLGSFFLLLNFSILAHQKITVYVEEFRGPDRLLNEEITRLFKAELLQLITVEPTDYSTVAVFVLKGAAREEHRKGPPYTDSTFTIDATLTEQRSGRILFSGSASARRSLSWRSVINIFRKDAPERAVADLVKQMKKRVGWR